MTLALLFFSVVEKVLNYDNATQILSFSLNLLWTFLFLYFLGLTLVEREDVLYHSIVLKSFKILFPEALTLKPPDPLSVDPVDHGPEYIL